MAALYAWSPIQAGDKSAKFGEEVSASGLGISKEDFASLVESGAVRSKKPPKLPDDWQGSVIDFIRKEAREAFEGTDDEAALEELNAIGELG
jgi:hypothetical protein